MPTLTTPRNADELTEMLADEKRRAEVLKDIDTLNGFINSYADERRRSDPGIEQQIKDEVQRQTAEILRNDQGANVDRLNLAPDHVRTQSANRGLYNRRAPGVKLDTQFDDWGGFLQNTWYKATSAESHAAKDRIGQVQNAFGSTVPADGGFLIPERLRADLLRVSLETAVVRPRARVIPMDSLTVPFPTIDSTTNATSVFGGVVGYWTEEGGTLTDSAPSFGRVTLRANKLTIYSVIPNELFQDSIISLDAFMSDLYPEAVSWFEDVAFISGDGVGKPLGYLNAPAGVSVAKETNQTAGTIVLENILKAYSRMLPSSLGRGVWIAHIDTMPELATMALSVGTGGSAVWLTNNGLEGGPPTNILGRPVIFTEKVPSVGSVGDIAFVDLSYYLIGDRMAMQAATSQDFRFGTDETAMRVIERVDGRPWIQSAVTPQTGSNQLSPFVKVATRA